LCDYPALHHPNFSVEQLGMVSFSGILCLLGDWLQIIGCGVSGYLVGKRDALRAENKKIAFWKTVVQVVLLICAVVYLATPDWQWRLSDLLIYGSFDIPVDGGTLFTASSVQQFVILRLVSQPAVIAFILSFLTYHVKPIISSTSNQFVKYNGVSNRNH